MKPIRLSAHAEANLVAREIPRADAEAAIRQPDRRVRLSAVFILIQ
jgi:hypothetical protein